MLPRPGRAGAKPPQTGPRFPSRRSSERWQSWRRSGQHKRGERSKNWPAVQRVLESPAKRKLPSAGWQKTRLPEGLAMRTLTLVLALALVVSGDASFAQELKEVAVLKGHTDYVSRTALSRDGKVLASGGGNATGSEVKLWDRATGKEIA